MKKLLLGLTLALALSACSEESKVKKAAIEGAKAQFQEEVREEISKGVTGKKNLQQTALVVLTDRTEFDVQKVSIDGTRAEAVVQALTVPPKVRGALVEIMGKLDEKKERNLNVSNALNMISEQMGLLKTQALIVYKVKLEKSDKWKALPGKP